MRTQRFGAVVFDMDGLLLDSERPLFNAWIEASTALGCAFPPELLLNVLGRSGKDGVAAFRAALGSEYPYDAVRTQVRALLAEAHKSGPRVKDGARELLLRLQASAIPCAVASSTRRTQVEEHLQKAGLISFFRAIAAGDEVERGKPAPDIFLLAAQRLAVAPSECLAFEDSEHGARAAVAAGMEVVIVPDLKQPSDEARAFSFEVLASLRETDALFQEWFVTDTSRRT